MSKSRLARERTPFEIVVLAVSMLAVAAIVAGLLLASAAGDDAPQDLRVSVGETSLRSGGVVYTVTVRNVGGETATNVVIEVAVGEETREIEIVSVAKGDEEEIAVVFPLGTTGVARAIVLSYHRATRD